MEKHACLWIKRARPQPWKEATSKSSGSTIGQHRATSALKTDTEVGPNTGSKTKESTSTSSLNYTPKLAVWGEDGDFWYAYRGTGLQEKQCPVWKQWIREQKGQKLRWGAFHNLYRHQCNGWGRTAVQKSQIFIRTWFYTYTFRTQT